MKVKDLFEKSPFRAPKIQQRNTNRIPRQYHWEAGQADEWEPDREKFEPSYARDKKREHLGTGVFGSTWGHKDNPHDVEKVSRSQQYLDGYYYFLKALSNSDMSDNPYFPRFRDLKLYKNDKGEQVYRVKMERLQSAADVRPEEWRAIIQRLYGDNAKKVVAGAEHDLTAQDISGLIDGIVSGYLDIDDIKDRQFKNAMMFLRKLARKEDLEPDIHDENIMVRRGPTGSTVVVTDPFSQ